MHGVRSVHLFVTTPGRDANIELFFELALVPNDCITKPNSEPQAGVSQPPFVPLNCAYTKVVSVFLGREIVSDFSCDLVCWGLIEFRFMFKKV